MKHGGISTVICSGAIFSQIRNPQKLEPLAHHLSELGYRFVSIYETDDRSTHFLHVERIETHTPTSLLKHTLQMNALAEQFGIDCYDGMDVGPLPTT